MAHLYFHALKGARLTHRKSNIALPENLRLYWAVLPCFALLSIAFSWIAVHWLHRSGFPWAFTLLPPEYNNGDFTCYNDRFVFFGQSEFFGNHLQPFNYPAPVALAYEAFHRFSTQPLRRFVEFVGLSYVVAAVLFARLLEYRGLRRFTAYAFAFSALLLSYPFFLAFYLSNMESIVWIVLTCGVWAWARNRSWTAALFFALAASLKYYPLIFLGLLLSRRQYKQAIFGISVFVVAMVGSLAMVGPTVSIAYHGLQAGVLQFRDGYIFQMRPLEFSIDHSLFGIVKLALVSVHRVRILPRLAGPYLILTAIAGTAIYLLRIRHLPPVNQLFALCLASVLLPPVSHVYTLIHMYAPWALLVLLILELPQGNLPRGTGWLLVFFSILFTPQSFLIVHNLRLAGSLKSLALLAMFVMVLRVRLPSPPSLKHLLDPASKNDLDSTTSGAENNSLVPSHAAVSE